MASLMYGYGFLSRGFTDRREILHGGSVRSQTGLFLFRGIAPEMAIFVDFGALKQPINRE